MRRDIDNNIILDSNVIPEILNSTFLHFLPKTSFCTEDMSFLSPCYQNLLSELLRNLSKMAVLKPTFSLALF